MNFEAVLHYKHQNQGRDEKKKLRHASGASANSEASNSDSEVDSTDHSPVPSPGQKKVNEVRVTDNYSKTFSHTSTLIIQCFLQAIPVLPSYKSLIRMSMHYNDTVCIVHAVFQVTNTVIHRVTQGVSLYTDHCFSKSRIYRSERLHLVQ